MNFHKTLLFSTILILIYPSTAAAQRGMTEQSALDLEIPSSIGGETFERIRDEAAQGNVNSQFKLGLAYLQENGVPRDHKEAAKSIKGEAK